MEIKQEKPSFSDLESASDSEPEKSVTISPSKIKTEPAESVPANKVPDEEDDDEELPEYNFIEEEPTEPGLQELADAMTLEENLKALDFLLTKTRVHGAMELKLKSYINMFPQIKPLPASDSAVDIDLANPDEDTWILQCPADVDIHSELLNKKINLSAPCSTLKHCSIPLKAVVNPNTGDQAIGLMCGSRIKSFVPAGFIRISELVTPQPAAVETAQDTNTVEIPFPTDIRQRHPLFGYDFEESMVVPDRVKERLSLARKKAEHFYTTPVPVTSRAAGTKKSKSKSKQIKQEPEAITVKAEPMSAVEDEFASPTKKAKKRKADPSTVPSPMKVIKLENVLQEEVAPEHTQVGKKSTTTIKKEDVEDDISWLLNI